MKIKVGGYSILFQYVLIIYRFDTLDKYENPFIRLDFKNKVKINNQWEDCNIYVLDKFIEIGAIRANGSSSNLGTVDEHITFKKIPISWFKKQLIKLYGVYAVFIASVAKIKIYTSIHKFQLLVISSALLVAILYYFINFFYEDKLKDFLNDSIGFQSIVVFLTISSFVNIFYPFTFRKEVNIKDVKNLSEKVSEKSIKKEKDKEIMNRRVRSKGKSV